MNRTRLTRLVPLLLGLGLGTSAAAADPTAAELLNRVDDFARGDSSHAVMRMTVKTKRYERSMEMEAWSKGTERSLVRILSPAKDKGVATLKVDDNIWNYLPKVDRTTKVWSVEIGSMMSRTRLRSNRRFPRPAGDRDRQR